MKIRSRLAYLIWRVSSRLVSLHPHYTLLRRMDDLLEVLDSPGTFSVDLYDARMRAVLGPFLLGRGPSKPYDDEIAFEKPRLIERSLDLILREGLATKVSTESAVGMYAMDIENSIGLDAGFLGEDVPNVKFPGLSAANRGLTYDRSSEP